MKYIRIWVYESVFVQRLDIASDGKLDSFYFFLSHSLSLFSRVILRMSSLDIGGNLIYIIIWAVLTISALNVGFFSLCPNVSRKMCSIHGARATHTANKVQTRKRVHAIRHPVTLAPLVLFHQLYALCNGLFIRSFFPMFNVWTLKEIA